MVTTALVLLLILANLASLLMARATTRQPKDALAWARLAELQLMLGNRGKASAAARKASKLAPDLGRTQTVLGYAALAGFRTGTAKKAFAKAVELNSSDPMPVSGLPASCLTAFVCRL